MKSPRFRLWLAIIVFLLSLGVLVASVWPEPRQSQELPLPELSLPTPEAWHAWPLAGAGG